MATRSLGQHTHLGNGMPDQRVGPALDTLRVATSVAFMLFGHFALQMPSLR